MSKIAIISDIHGDLNALQTAFEIIKEEKCTKIICLGDVINDNSENEKIINLLNEHKTINIRGNHEQIETVEETPLIKTYLENCRDEITVGGFHFCHVIKRIPEISVYNDIEAWNIFDEFPWNFIFIGHNHLPAIFVYDENMTGNCIQIQPAKGISFLINKGTRCIISVGALAYGRDFHSRKSFVIYENNKHSIDYFFLD